MQSFLWEKFQGAMRNLSFFHWIILTAVAFCQIWNDDLHMTFGTQRSRFKQRHFILDASLINVSSGSNIVQCVSNNRQRLEELVVENIFSCIRNPLQQWGNMSLEIRVHGKNTCCSSKTLRLRNMLFTEQKLTIEIRVLDVVRVSQHYLSLRTGA
jgi:hypothetical protein